VIESAPLQCVSASLYYHTRASTIPRNPSDPPYLVWDSVEDMPTDRTFSQYSRMNAPSVIRMHPGIG